ncbi:hypothetical protein QGN23_14740 [Chryseobacterium gotjawalense]|uniref:Transporter n=1 Tax=Chryseobacterium gotjawalense TaxID=3042315 RepID=A0ABY8RCE7_9FLAO|nr:hypothetical protein [Chryseobacterium sp. wdc7]WHF51660.1 hypothetical protein QGN23_14740 [Chryseobacterium sp. wdc7]
MSKNYLYSAFLIILFLFPCIIQSQTLINYTTNYFGPNANPVPDFTNASISKNTEFSVYGDYYFGYGDQTADQLLKVEIPLLPEKISVKLWIVPIEYYTVTDAVKERRMMSKNSGLASGDFYLQTRIALFNEKERKIAVILNATLKTASGSDSNNRRFFNTAGYYFDTEIGKSFEIQNSFLNEIRLVANAGFYSWDVQTPNNDVQDDAIMYGLKVILKKKNISWENTISGYSGWIKRVDDYGDRPIVLATKLNLKGKQNTYFLQYQYGIKYFPFNQIRIGAVFPLASLTPNFLK